MNMKSYSHRFGWLNALVVFSIIFLFLCLLFIESFVVLRGDGDEEKEKCLSNLKQIGLALKQYALDNNETFPWGNMNLQEIEVDKKIMKFSDVKITGEKLGIQPFQSFGMLHPSYAFSSEIFTCPSSHDAKWDEKKAHFNGKDNTPFIYGSCKESLSYAYGINKDAKGKGVKGPWTEAAASTTRIAGDKYACADYSKGDIKNRPGNHDAEGRCSVYLDGSAEWDDAKTPLEADYCKKYPETSNTPESDQTGADWWSDPPEKE